MNQTSRRTCCVLSTLAIAAGIFLAREGTAQDATADAVRQAAEEHVRASGGEMSFDDPEGDGRLTLVFDHVHDGVKETAGGRQVVCVDFERAAGTVYDVDFYVDRAEDSGELRVEDAVVHKVSGENVLPDARRAELDRKS